MNCSDSQITQNKSLFNQHDSSLDRHVNTSLPKSLKFKTVVYQKTKNPFGAKMCMNISFQLFSRIMKVNCKVDQ